jgi:hypothetical protein
MYVPWALFDGDSAEKLAERAQDDDCRRAALGCLQIKVCDFETRQRFLTA